MRLTFKHSNDMLLGRRQRDDTEMRAPASQFDFKVRDAQLLKKGPDAILEEMTRMARPWMERLHQHLVEEQRHGSH